MYDDFKIVHFDPLDKTRPIVPTLDPIEDRHLATRIHVENGSRASSRAKNENTNEAVLLLQEAKDADSQSTSDCIQ